MVIVLRARGIRPGGPSAVRGSAHQPDVFLAFFAALSWRKMS